MEDAPRLDWSKAEVEPGGIVKVPWLEPVPSNELGGALWAVVARMEDEARDQQWEGIYLAPDGVTVSGVADPTASEQLRIYLQEACDRAPIELERVNKALADAEQRDARAAEKAERDADELQRRLRGA